MENCRHIQPDEGKAYTNPKSNILRTPSQKIKYKSLGEQSPDGNWAIGNRKPPSLKKMNCNTWVAS